MNRGLRKGYNRSTLEIDKEVYMLYYLSKDKIKI